MKLIVLVSLICFSWFVKAQSTESIKKYFLREFIEEKYHNPSDKEKALKEIGFETHQTSPILNSENKSLYEEDGSLQVGAEPHIAINPNNPNHIVVTFMSVGGEFEFPVYYSFDAGETWTKSDYSIASSFKTHMGITEELEHGGDPILAFDNNGKLYFSWLFVHDNIGTTGFVFSNDGGVTFNEVNAESIINSGSTQEMEVLDREWLAVDNSGDENEGTLYMSAFYLGQIFNDNGQIVLTKPAGSNTFNTTVTSASPFDMVTAPQFGNIKVDNSGNIHISCMQYSPQDGAGHIVYSRSTDGAASFTELNISSNHTQTNGNAILHSRENAAVSMDIDGDNVYITWSDYSDSDIQSYYVYSNNNGIDWSSPINLNTLLGTDMYYLMPNVSADNGKMAISFYAADKTSKIGSYYIVSSADMGQSLGAAVEISSVNTDFNTVTDSEFMGDYNTSLMQGCDVYSIWSNKSDSQIKIYLGITDICSTTGIMEYNTVNGSFDLDDIYPNPIQEDLNLNLHSSKNQNIVLEIISLDGKKILKKDFTIFKGQNTIETNISKLTKGVYLLKLSNASNDIISKKIIKL